MKIEQHNVVILQFLLTTFIITIVGLVLTIYYPDDHKYVERLIVCVTTLIANWLCIYGALIYKLGE